jgi:hypothetical protein
MSKKLLRTADLVKLLQDNDPSGDLIVSFMILDEDDGLPVAHGEITDLEVHIRHARQTEEGDRDVLRLMIELDCEG